MKPSLSSVLALCLAVLIFSPMITLVSGVVYEPAVSAGQWGKYKPVYNICTEPTPSLCDLGGSGIGNIDFAAIQVVAVSGQVVTLKLVSVYTNGTGSAEGLWLNVATGTSNVTALTTSGLGYFVIAGGLQAGNNVWDTPTAPTLNQTLPETVLGQPRNVNFLNHTSTYSYGPASTTMSTGFALDQASGILIELSLNITSSSPYGGSSKEAFALRMVDNNIWLTSSLPDFSTSASPTSVSTSQGSPGTSTITITRTTGFSTTVKLTVQPSSGGIYCSISPSSLSAGGPEMSTLSCDGSPGDYTIVVTGDSGYQTHTASVTFHVAGGTNPSFSISSSGSIEFQTGSSGSSAITIAAQNGFSSTVNLQVTSPSGLSCSLSPNSLQGYGSSTLTCSGQPGTYTVTVTATSGSINHSTPVSVRINSLSASNQPSNSMMLIIYAAIGIAAIVAVLAAYVLMRRKSAPPATMQAATTAP